MINIFESYSPVEFLKVKYKGVKPTDRDLKLLEMLLYDLKLPAAVVNVLIDYTLKTKGNKLSRSYVETLAGQWKRNGIETASEAMDLAEKEHKKLYNNQTIKPKKVIPEWIYNKFDSKDSTPEEDEEFKNFIEEFRK